MTNTYPKLWVFDCYDPTGQGRRFSVMVKYSKKDLTIRRFHDREAAQDYVDKTNERLKTTG